MQVSDEATESEEEKKEIVPASAGQSEEQEKEFAAASVVQTGKKEDDAPSPKVQPQAHPPP